jgi:hypothetical protein
MAASKPEIIMILDIVQQYSGAKSITMQTNREWKIQDGGHRTESIYISASGRYSKDILMAIGLPMFMGSSAPIALRKSLYKKRKWKIIQDGGQVFKQRYEYFSFRVAAILPFHFRFCCTAFSVFP